MLRCTGKEAGVKSDDFENLSDLFDHLKINKSEFGRAMGWKPAITYMKLDRQRPWTVPEYERGLKWLRDSRIQISRYTMIRFATPRREDGNS